MRDCAVIAGGSQTDNGRILHSDRQKPRKSPFDRGPLIINCLEVTGAVIDGVADAGRKPKEIVAPFLVHELGMPRRTEKILSSIGFAPVKGTRVLKIDSAFGGHPALPMHGEIGGTEDRVPLEAERIILRTAGIERDDGLGFHFEGDIREDVLAVIIGISGHSGNRQSQGRDLSQHGNGNLFLIPVIRVGDLIKREFGFRVDDDMVAVAPVEHHFGLEGLGKMDFDAEPGVGITAREFRFVEAVSGRGFKVVLPDVGLDGTGVQREDVAADDFFLDQRPDEIYPDIFQVLMGCHAEKKGEAFTRGRVLEHWKPAGRCNREIVLQFEGQVGQRSTAAETLINQSAKESIPGKWRTSSGADLLSQNRQVGKQFFETHPRRNLFGLEKAFHDLLDFREGHRKMSLSRVSEARGLGYVVDSYEKRSMGRRRGVARKSPILTQSKTRPQIGNNQAYSLTGIAITNLI